MEMATILTTDPNPNKPQPQPALSKNGKKIGRPRKADLARSETGEHWADQMVRMYNEGMGDTEICRELKITPKQFQKRVFDEPLFAQLVEFGQIARKGYWLELGRKAAKTGAPSQAFNFWISFMKNEFGWSEKTEVKDANAKMSDEDLQEKFKSLVKKLKHVPASLEMAQRLEAIP